MAPNRYLGEFEQMLLLAAMRLGEDAYGVRLMEELEHTVGRSVSRGSVYVTLDRMEGKGWIASEMSEARSERGGRPRRFRSIRQLARGPRGASRSRPDGHSFRRPKAARAQRARGAQEVARGAAHPHGAQG